MFIDDEKDILYKDRSGNIEAVQVGGKVEVETSVGTLIPVYSVEDHGRISDTKT